MANDSYWTIVNHPVQELRIRGSRFIGMAEPVDTEDAARSFFEAVRKRFHDATHHCTAFRIGTGDRVTFRYNDDGEPSGTAGKPILDAITGRNLTQVALVVTRYFGGTKLGTGGLARAYGECAGLTLDSARRVEKILTTRLRLCFAYDLTGVVMGCLARWDARTAGSDYGNETCLDVEIRRSRIEGFAADLTDVCSGRIEIQKEDRSASN